jgi:hypothetical protein
VSRADDAAAWEDLVRRLESMDGGSPQAPDAAGPGQADGSPERGETGRTGGPTENEPGTPRAAPPAGPASPSAGPRAVAGFDFAIDPALLGPRDRGGSAAPPGAGPRDWAAAEDPHEGDFLPPEPEPILAGRPDRVVAWAAAIGLPLLMIALTIFFPGAIPPLLWPVLLIGALAAWAYLFWRLPTDRADDTDDGARL